MGRSLGAALIVVLVAFSTGHGTRKADTVVERCKRHEVSHTGPSEDDGCARFSTCLQCVATSGECGWCGGAGCGPSSRACYNASLHFKQNSIVCQHPEDIFMQTPDLCPDACTEEQTCMSCLAYQLPETLQKQNFSCGWGGSCLIGKDSGPLSTMEVVTDWRWLNNGHSHTEAQARCADYNPCGEQTRCKECTESYESLTTPCIFCKDPKITIDVEGAGGGTCRANQCKDIELPVASVNINSCPRMPGNDASGTASTNQPVSDGLRPLCHHFSYLFFVAPNEIRSGRTSRHNGPSTCSCRLATHRVADSAIGPL